MAKGKGYRLKNSFSLDRWARVLPASVVLVLVLVFGIAERFKPYESAFLNNTYLDDKLSVHYIDVGQADSVLLLSAGEAMLIDGGEKETAADVVKYIRQQGIKELSYIVATHPHSDHIGGIGDVLMEFSVKNILMPNVTHNTKTFEGLLDSIEAAGLEITIPKQGDTFALGDALITVLSPGDENYDNLNNYSIVLRAVSGDTSYLFMGDAESQVERQLLDSEYEISSTALKVGHHGSNTSSTDDFLKAVSPEYAVISCGENNEYNHPHKEVIERLEIIGAEILITYKLGTIVMGGEGN